MQPYVIKDGDFLALLAYKLSFDPDAVWSDPANEDLRSLRPDPNLLLATDVVYVPSQTGKAAPAHDLVTGSTTTFVSDPPTVTVAIKFVGPDTTSYASKAYVVRELDSLTGLTTDADGIATFEAPVDAGLVTIAFTDTGEERPLRIGGMDPVETISGIAKRLQNLGYLSFNIKLDSSNLYPLRVALASLKQNLQPDDDPPPSSAPPSSQGDDSLPQPDASAETIDVDPTWNADADSPPSSGPPDSSAPASAPASSGDPPSSAAPDSAPPSSAPPSSAPEASSDDESEAASDDDSSAAPDDAGLADDGTLSDEMRSLLVGAHGY